MRSEIKEIKSKELNLTKKATKLRDAHDAIVDLETILGKPKVRELLKEVKLAQRVVEKEAKKVRGMLDKAQAKCKHGAWINLGYYARRSPAQCGHCGWIDTDS